MIQQAKEDLELLETQHPNQFEYLKHDLRSFIFLLQPQQLPGSALQLSLVSTQASTCEKRTKKSKLSSLHAKMGRRRSGRYTSNKLQTLDCFNAADRVDLVLEKAQSCLRKIQDFKSGLY